MDAQISDGIVRSSSSATEHGESNESSNEGHYGDGVLSFDLVAKTWCDGLYLYEYLPKYLKTRVQKADRGLADLR
jgi:hypothetical protein